MQRRDELLNRRTGVNRTPSRVNAVEVELISGLSRVTFS